MNTYTATRQSYYEKNAPLIKEKRRIRYQKNIQTERESAKQRHQKNKSRNNKISLDNYHANSNTLNKKRMIGRFPPPNVQCINCNNTFRTKKDPNAKLSKNKPQCPECKKRVIINI